MHSKSSYKVENGSKVAVVGGGPAGSFFSLYLMQYAEQKNIRPDITIYQDRNFNELGPKGCKGCAGVVYPSLLTNLQECNLRIPEEIIQSRIEGFALHGHDSSVRIGSPEKMAEMASVYRGNGPRTSCFEEYTSFDSWLLEQAQKRGATVKAQKVSGICLDRGATIEVGGSWLEYDLVVLSSGIDMKNLPVVGLNYVPPTSTKMTVAELYAGADEVQSRLGNMVHVFQIPHAGLICGTLVPKGQFINVSILARGNYPFSIDDFLDLKIVRDLLPTQYERVCVCRPRTAVGSANNFYTDRFVTVGDAAVSRIYKDGIGSAVSTARMAAHVAIQHGIARRDFKRHYHSFCRKIDRDNIWGKLFFSLYCHGKKSKTFILAYQSSIKDEQQNTGGPQQLIEATLGILTGSYSYAKLFRMFYSITSALNLLKVLLMQNFRNLFKQRGVLESYGQQHAYLMQVKEVPVKASMR
jgi:flavin-dependent dehydrogenase